jgi:hypothetical protein
MMQRPLQLNWSQGQLMLLPLMEDLAAVDDGAVAITLPYLSP